MARPIHYEWAAQAASKASGHRGVFENGTAKTAIKPLSEQGSPFFRISLLPTPRAAILDNNLHDQYAILGRLYDWKHWRHANFSCPDSSGYDSRQRYSRIAGAKQYQRRSSGGIACPLS